jgi:RES domain-containing protein
MRVYRISSPQYAGDLSGNGAKLYGGRWNEKGTAVVYFASSRAMAMMELLVHLHPEDLQRQYVIVEFEVPEDKILKVTIEELPFEWQSEAKKKFLKKRAQVLLKRANIY